MRGGWETKSARRLIDLVGLPRRSPEIYYSRRITRMYLLCSFALRIMRFAPDLDGSLGLATTSGRVRRDPSRWHGCALPEAAVEGTCGLTRV